MKMILSILYYIFAGVGLFIHTLLIIPTWLFSLVFDRKQNLTHLQNCIVARYFIAVNPFWKYEVEGLENFHKDETYVIAANHQSLVDILVINSLLRKFKWVSKAELGKIPLLGWTMFFARYVLISRKDPKSQFSMMKKCQNYLKSGVSVTLFPEGTRSKDGKLKRFKDGAFLLAHKTNTKILPVVINSYNPMPKKGMFWKKKETLKVTILPAIEPREFGKIKELRDFTREKFTELLPE